MKEDTQQTTSSVATVTLTRKSYRELLDKLEDAVGTLDAIRHGVVDAVVVEGENGPTVYTLTGADHPYRNYVERMQEGAVTVDSNGLVLYANRQFADMAERPLSEVIGSNLQDYITKKTWAELGTVFEKAADSVKVDAQLRKKKGKRQAQFTAGLLTEEDKPVACLVVTDLTGQRENARLQLAKEVAERENATKDAFLAALSHELRTPLTPAFIAASLLEQEVLSENGRSQLATLRRNIELEARLIDDLLDLTRIANGKYEFRPEPVDVHQTLKLALDTCQSEIDANQHRVEVDLQAANPLVQGDPVRLQQLFWNLLRNAAKFTPAKGAIVVSTRETGNGSIRVSIKDNGIGIDSKQLESIFTAFSQASKRITSRFGGLGLGLTISRAIAEAHGGAITAKSSGRKKGSTFSVILPNREPTDATEPQAPRHTVTAADPTSRRALNVLLVEDNADSRRMLTILIKAHGHRVTPVDNSTDALQLVDSGNFDLLICDIGLPDMSGHELLRLIRQKQQLQAIAISGYGMQSDLAKSERAGFQRHFIKPIDPPTLIESIEEFARSAAPR